MKAKLLVMTFIFFCYFGCTPLPVPRQSVNTFTIKAPFDQGWKAAIESFADLQLPIQNSEKTLGRITTENVCLRGSWKQSCMRWFNLRRRSENHRLCFEIDNYYDGFSLPLRLDF